MVSIGWRLTFVKISTYGLGCSFHHQYTHQKAVVYECKTVSSLSRRLFYYRMKIYRRQTVVKLFLIVILKNLSLFRSRTDCYWVLKNFLTETYQLVKCQGLNSIDFRKVITFCSASWIVTVPFASCWEPACTKVAPDGTVCTCWPDWPDWGTTAPWLIIWSWFWPPLIIWPWGFTNIVGWFDIIWNWGWTSWTCWGIITHCVYAGGAFPELGKMSEQAQLEPNI